jgi:glycosyltransferase involved in cell wall biosynthesis
VTDRQIRPPRVLVIGHQYHPVPGPATLRLGALVRAMTEWADVTVLTASSNQLPNEITGPVGERIIPVGVPDATGQSIRRIGQLLAFAAAAYRKSASLGDFDYVVFDPPPTAAIAALVRSRRSRAKAVYYFCDSWAQFSRRGGIARRFHKLIEGFENWALRRADVVVAAEQPLFDDASQRGATHVVLVENGADVALVRPLDGTDVVTRPQFIYAGTHSEVHGASIFIEAAELLWESGYDFELLFVGDGTDADAFDEYAKHEHRFTRRPAVPMSHLGDLLNASIASLVSLSEVPPGYYQIPSKMYTSLAAGCPVLYAGQEGPMGFLKERAASFVVPRDARRVADRMTELLAEAVERPAEHAVRRKAARRYAVEARDFAANLTALSHRMRDDLYGVSLVDPK